MKPVFDSISELINEVESENIHPEDLSIKQYDDVLQISIDTRENMLPQNEDSITTITKNQKQYLYIGETTEIVKDLLRAC